MKSTEEKVLGELAGLSEPKRKNKLVYLLRKEADWLDYQEQRIQELELTLAAYKENAVRSVEDLQYMERLLESEYGEVFN